MIDGLKPYPEYKDSGVSWLGEVPAHWKLLPHRALFQEVNERSHPDEPLLSVTIARGVIPQEVLLANSSKKDSSNLDKSHYKLVQPGDIAYNKMRAWQGAIGVSRHRGIVSPAYVVVRPRRQQVPEYYHYLLRTPGFITEAERWSYGITSDMWSLRSEDFKRIYSVLPPYDEQRAIARFLDHHDRLTRRYIRAQRRLIELLTEQKQALIQQAATRGLDPDVPLKDSGIEWLGKIPEHWEATRVRSLVESIDQGVSPQAEVFLADDNSWGVLKSGCVNGGVFRETEHKRLPNGFEIDPEIVVKVGDVLVSRACGSPRFVGSVGRVESLNYRLILSDKTFRLNFTNHRLVDFLVLAMNSRYFRIQVEQGISGAEGLANNLPLSELKDFRVVIPPTAEAEALATVLRSKIGQIDKAVARAQRQIDLIREYRTRLIADVVTGKLDVRGVSTPDLDEAGDVGDLDELIEDVEMDDLDAEELDDADD